MALAPVSAVPIATPSQTGASSFAASAQPLLGGKTATNQQAESIVKASIPSPTVVTDANTRESSIPSIQGTAAKLGAINPPVSPTAQQNANKGASTDMDSTYEDIYNKAFGNVSNQPLDPATNSILQSINAMKTSSDASTKAQLDAITSGYDARQAMLTEANQSTTAQLAGLLMQGGSIKTGSASATLNTKAQGDVQALTNLSNEETAAKASVYKAQQDMNFQLMDKQNQLLQNIQDRKYSLAKSIADGVTAKNQADRDYLFKVEQFNHTKTQDEISNEQAQARIDQEAKKIDQGKYEFRDMKDDLGNVIGTQVFDKSTGRPVSAISNPGSSVGAPGSNGALAPVGLGADGTVDQAAQNKFLATLPPPVSALVSAMINYQGKPPNPSSKTGQKLLEYAHMADPTFDESQYLERQKVNIDYTSGKTSQNVKSLNTSIQHAGDLAKDFVNLPNGDITKINSVKEWFAMNKGNGNPTKVINDLNALGGELAKTFKGTAGTDSEIANIEKGINLNSSPEQFKAFIESSMNLLGGRVSALDESYTQSMGGKTFGETHAGSSLLNPTAAKLLGKLKDSGYDINVPGVYFSDKDAFLKTDSEGGQQKLQDAYDQLKMAGLDTTPENILQAAQII